MIISQSRIPSNEFPLKRNNLKANKTIHQLIKIQSDYDYDDKPERIEKNKNQIFGNCFLVFFTFSAPF